MQVGDPKHQKEVFDERLEEVSPQVSGFFEIFVHKSTGKTYHRWS